MPTLEQVLQAIRDSEDGVSKTINKIYLGEKLPPAPTLGGLVTPPASEPLGIVQPEPGVSSQAELGMSPLGFTQNILSGIGTVGIGLGSLITGAGHDILKGVASAVPDISIGGEPVIPNFSIEESPTALLGMAGAMTGYDEWMPVETTGFIGLPTKLGLPEGEDAPSAMMEDLKARYTPLLKGDIGGFVEQLYEKPISFGLDALMVAGAPGAVGRGASFLSKGAPIRGFALAKPLAKSAGLQTVADYLVKFRYPAGANIANPKMASEIRYPIGGQFPFGMTDAGVIIPDVREMAVLGQLQKASVGRRASINPLVRLAKRGLHNLASTKTVPGINMPVSEALAMLDDPAKSQFLADRLTIDLGTGKAFDYGNQLIIAKMLQQGSEILGYSTSPRLYRPWALRLNQTTLMKMRQAHHGAALIDLRELVNEFNRNALDPLNTADEVTMVEDLLVGQGDHRTPYDSSLLGSRNFDAEAAFADMGTEPYQLGWDAMFSGATGRQPGITEFTARNGKRVEVPTDYEPNMFEGLDRIPRPEDRPEMFLGEPDFRGFTELRTNPPFVDDISGPRMGDSMYPNPRAVDIRGGAGLRRGARIEFEPYEGREIAQARYLHTDEEGMWVDFGNGPELAPDRPWHEVIREEGGETAAEMQARLLGEEFAPKVGAPAKAVPTEKIEPVSGYPDRYIVTYTDDGGNAISFGVRKTEGTTQGTRQAGAGGVVANRRTKTVWKIDKDPYGISYPTRKAAIEDYKRSRASTGGVADEMTAAGKADAARRAELKAAAETPLDRLGEQITANHEQVAAIEAAHPDQTFMRTATKEGVGPEMVKAPEGDAFVTMYDDTNFYRYSRNTGELLETTARKDRGGAMAGWNVEDVIGEKKIENLEGLGVDFDDMPNSVIDWLDEGGKVEEWIKDWLNSGDEQARQFIDDWGRNVDGFRTLKAPAAVGWRKIVFGTGDEDFVLVPMNRADKAQFFKRMKDTMTEVEEPKPYPYDVPAGLRAPEPGDVQPVRGVTNDRLPYTRAAMDENLTGKTIQISLRDARELLEFPKRKPRAKGESGTAGPLTIEYDPATGKGIISEGMHRIIDGKGPGIDGQNVTLSVKIVDTPTIEREGSLAKGTPAKVLSDKIVAAINGEAIPTRYRMGRGGGNAPENTMAKTQYAGDEITVAAMAEPPKVAETSDELKAIVAANEKIQILRDQGIDVSQEQAAIIIAEEVKKATGEAPMELAKAKPTPAKPAAAPAILRPGEGKAVWNGVELKPGSEHTMKVLGWRRNLKVTIKGESTLNDQLGIRYVRKTQKSGESSNFAPYNSIEAIDGKQRLVPEPAKPQAAAPAPTLKATVAAKPKVEPKAPPKAVAAEFAGLDVDPRDVGTAPWNIQDPLLPDYGTYTPADISFPGGTRRYDAEQGRWVGSEVTPTLDTPTPYTILDPDGNVEAVFATRGEALDYANVYGGDVVLPGAVDLPPLKVSEPTVPLTPPPVTPFSTRFAGSGDSPNPPPRATSLDEKPIGVSAFQRLIGDKPNSGEYEGAEMYANRWYSSKGRPARFFHYIDNMRNVDRYISEDAKKLGGRVLDVRNTLNDGGDVNPKYGDWRALNAWIELPDGDIIELQYLTPGMKPHAIAASNAQMLLHEARGRLDENLAAIKQITDSVPEGKKFTKAQEKQLKQLADEVAILEDDILAQRRQAGIFNEGIVRELANPNGYDRVYKAADNIRSNWYNSQLIPEFGHLPFSALSASQQLDRSYLVSKVKHHDLWLIDLQQKMKAVVDGIPKDADVNVVPLLKAMVTKNLDEMLKNSKYLTDEDLPNSPLDGGVAAFIDDLIPNNPHTTDPVKYVIDKVDNATKQAVSDGRATDKAVAFWQDMFNFRWQDMDNEFPMGFAPGYYPFINMSKTGPGGYLGRMHNLSALNTGEPEALGLAKGTLARNRNYVSTHHLRSFEDYRKMTRFKNASNDEIHLQRLMDAKQAVEDVYSLRATQLGRHRQVLDFIDEIKAFSRPVTPAELVMWGTGGVPGYKLMDFDQVKAHVNIRSEFTDQVFKDVADSRILDNTGMPNTMDFGGEDTFTKITSNALDKVMKDAEDEALRAILNGTAESGEHILYAVPEHLVSEFNRNVGRAMGWKVRFGVDAPMNVWKNLVLSFSPRWIVNNTVGNTVFTLIENPGALMEMVRLRDKKYRETWQYIFEGMFPEGVERGLFARSTQRVTNYGFAENVAPKLAGTYKTLRGQPNEMSMAIPEVLKPGMSLYMSGARRTGKAASGARAFNSGIEDAFRRAVFTNQVRKAVLKDTLKGVGTDLQIFEALQKNPARKQEWVGNAIVSLNQTLGDYTNLTPVERNIVRRFLLPFYPFYKHSAKFLLRLPIAHPFKAATLLTLGTLDQEMMQDYPEYLNGTVGIGWWGGQQLLMRFRGMNPLSGITSQGIIPGLNPALQTGLSFAYGINTFTGEPLTSGDIVSDFSGNKMQVIRDDKGQVIGVKPLPDGYKLHPSAYRMLQTLVPQVNVVGGIMAGIRGDDVGARYSGSGEIIMDPETGKPKYPQPWFKDPVSFLGAPLSTVDPVELALDERAQQESLANAWQNRGGI